MKQGWTYKRLGEVATIIGGSTPKTSIEEYWGGTHYWVTPANLDGNKYQGATPRTITDLAVKETNLQLLPTGTVLLSSRAPIGKVAITTVPMYCNQGFKNIVCSNLLINEFVYWYLFGKVDYLNSLGKGATFKEISKKTTEQIPIPVPSLEEQQHIVDYLNAAFAQIDELKSNAEKQLAEARALFQSALTQAMQPKLGWQEKTLGEIATDMYRGSGIRRDQITKEGIPCVRYGEIYTTYNISFEDCVSHTLESSIASPKYFEHGDLLFAITGESVEDIGKTIAYMGNEKCLLGGDIICMKHNQNPKFLSYALSTTDAIKQKGFGKTKLKVVHTNAPSLKAIRLPLPPLPEQQSIVEQLDSISTNISLLEEINQKIKPDCDALKQALLRQIFE